jgi:TonB-linked SusC/RagA family outer membrane protein
MRYRRFVFFLFACLSGLSFFTAQAQTSPVRGKVTSETGSPVEGANILLKNSDKGVATNAKGDFTIDAGSGDVLLVSATGFTAKEVPVNGQSTVDVVLRISATDMEQVVVVGYGTRRRKEVTGSVASVKAEELKVMPVANLAQGLQGRVAGLDMRQNSGTPGGNITIRIRGTNSINGSSEPLYVIDGIQISATSGINAANPLSQINPSDIESVEVLKDAAATAVYGARAANGVVLITTRRGREGVTRVSYDGYFGQQSTTKKMAVLNAAEFAQLENDIYAPSMIYADPKSMGEGVNYQDLIFRTANIQNHQLSVTGGNDKTQVAFGANYFNQEGVIRNSDFKRYAFRTNIDHAINNRFKVGSSLYYTITNENRVNAGGTDLDVTSARNGILGRAVGAPPTLQPYRSNGAIFPFADQYSGRYKEVVNPLGDLEIKNYNSVNRTLANVFLDVTIFKGLTYRASFNADIASGLGEFYSPRSIVDSNSLANPNAVNGFAANNSTYTNVLLHESILTYRTTYKKNHSINATAVFGTQKDIFQINNQSASGFGNDFTQNYATANATNRTVSSFRSKTRLDSYLGRIGYGFKDKYFVDLTARVDGSSKFGENKKYGFFPAVSGAWRVIEEEFLKPSTVFSDFKLRASYGITGNAGAIGPYASLATVNGQGFDYNFNNALAIGINPAGIPNPDLRWEKSTQYNIGLDIGLFSNRLSIVADYYNKQTDDLLFTKSIPISSGYTSITGNYGSIENKGLELALTGRILTGRLKWDASGNITFNKNKVLALDGIQDETPRSSYSILKVGYPMGVFKTYLSNGITQTGEPLMPGYDARIGGYKVKDVNGDGKISAEDQVIVGNAQPNYFFGFSTTLRYSRFDLSGFVQGVQGSKIFNAFRYTFENPLGQQNVLKGLANRWSPTNANNDFVKGFQGGRLPLTDRWVEDNSFVRVRNITLGYTVPNYKWIRGVRLYVSGNNLFTFTKYQGWDPESNSFSSSNTLFYDNGTYPAAKSYVFGLQANF